MNHNLLDFDMTIGRQKPVTMFQEKAPCPFCDRKHLTGIIACEDSILLLRNKYNVLKGTDQFVLIESDVCHSDMPDYSKEHMQKLIRFGIRHWQRLLHSGLYEDVLFFKNFGPLSGGTIRHPHMQLIGLPKLDSPLTVHPEEFTGPVIYERSRVQMTVSDHPHIGFWEFNLIADARSAASIDTLADYLQLSTDYITHYFHNGCHSYNIFFYHYQQKIFVKLIPHFSAPPLFIGYNIRVRPTNYPEMVQEFHKIYGCHAE